LRASTSARNTFYASPQPRTSTVNDAEIAHFSHLSPLWDEHGEFSLLHKMNAHRMRFIREKVLEVLREEHDAATIATCVLGLESSCVLEGLDVLDVGCGSGMLSEVCFSL
jgi:polyprenyldihydroxybenzoate methyltransferase / 3-demethylubiquinol 3-O-methyltransferase